MAAEVRSPKFGIRNDNWAGLLVLFTVASMVEAGFWNQMNVFTPLYLPQLGITSEEDIRTWTGASAAIANFVGLKPISSQADAYLKLQVSLRPSV